MDRSAILGTVREALQATDEGTLTAYLFGSFGRGEEDERSDVDLGVLYAEDPPGTLDSPPRRLEDRLARALDRDVQVVALNRASCDLVHRVLRDGILLLDRDPSARIEFEVRKRREYYDLLPILEEYRRFSGRSA